MKNLTIHTIHTNPKSLGNGNVHKGAKPMDSMDSCNNQVKTHGAEQ